MKTFIYIFYNYICNKFIYLIYDYIFLDLFKCKCNITWLKNSNIYFILLKMQCGNFYEHFIYW